MKPKTAHIKTATPAKGRTSGLAPLIAEVRNLIQSARRGVASAVDTFQVMTNFEIGRRIVEHEQKGEKRAGYGQEMLKALSTRLTEEFGRGFSVTNLQLMRKFFIENQIRIQQQPTVKLVTSEIGRQATDQLQIPQRPSGELVPIHLVQKPSAQSARAFTLSWTHYVILLTVKDPDERSFYEIEATTEGWSVPELKRQKASCLYERLALSRDKAGIKLKQKLLEWSREAEYRS